MFEEKNLRIMKIVEFMILDSWTYQASVYPERVSEVVQLVLGDSELIDWWFLNAISNSYTEKENKALIV